MAGAVSGRAPRTLRLAEREADEIRARAVEEASIALTQVRVAAQAALDELRRLLLARVEAEGRRLDAHSPNTGIGSPAAMAAPRRRSWWRLPRTSSVATRRSSAACSVRS